MKKILSLALAGVMMFSTLPVAYATNSVNQDTAAEEKASTTVTFDASTVDANGDGVADNKEAYTVTVPASMAPGDTGYVVASGTWASNRKLVVGLKENNVVLENSINSADTKTLALTFAGIELVGDNTAAVTNVVADTAPNGTAISVAAISDALFGTWEGVFEYTVSMEDVA